MSPLQCYAFNNKSFTSSSQDSQPFPLARVFQHTSAIVDLDIEGYLNLLRKESESVCKDNGPVPRQEEFGPDQPTLRDVYRLFERFERELKGVKSHLDKTVMLANEMRGTRQRLAGLEQDARQPLLAMEADGQADTKTPERTEGAAKAVQAMHGYICSVHR